MNDKEGERVTGTQSKVYAVSKEREGERKKKI